MMAIISTVCELIQGNYLQITITIKAILIFQYLIKRQQ